MTGGRGNKKYSREQLQAVYDSHDRQADAAASMGMTPSRFAEVCRRYGVKVGKKRGRSRKPDGALPISEQQRAEDQFEARKTAILAYLERIKNKYYC